MFANKILKGFQIFLTKEAELNSAVLCQDNSYVRIWLSGDKYFE